jgi:hypothetical protein
VADQRQWLLLGETFALGPPQLYGAVDARRGNPPAIRAERHAEAAAMRPRRELSTGRNLLQADEAVIAGGRQQRPSGLKDAPLTSVVRLSSVTSGAADTAIRKSASTASDSPESPVSSC